MRRNVALLITVALSVIMLGGGAATRNTTQLPGARRAINAANFGSIQAALDAIPDQGGLIRLPAGTFEITSPLRIRQGDVCVVGSGTATHIKNRNTDGQPAIVIADADHKLEGNQRNHELWRVRLHNLRITGNPDSGDGIIAHNINELLIDGLSVTENGGDGIELSFCYEDPRIVNTLITYNQQTGLNLIGCHDIVVSANQFEENQDALHCFDGFNLCMTGNCLDDHLRYGVVIENTYGSVVSGNMIEECQSAAVVMNRNCYGNTISANVIAHNGAGVDLRDAHGCAVSANTFTIMQDDAVRVSAESGRITLAANNFSDSYIGESTFKRAQSDRAAAGIDLTGAAHVLVTSNTFSGTRPQAIETDSESAGWLNNNLFISTEPGIETMRLDETQPRHNISAE